MADKTVWQTIYDKLKSEGIEVYSVGQHKGECIRPYTVLRDDGTTTTVSYSSNIKTYTILCYVPMNNFSELEVYTEKVKGIMKKLFPLVRPNGTETPAFLDDTVKAHMISVQYSNYRKVNYWY